MIKHTRQRGFKIWGYYVKPASVKVSKMARGSYRKFGHTLVVTTDGMEAVTGLKIHENKRLSYDGRFWHVGTLLTPCNQECLYISILTLYMGQVKAQIS